MGPRNSRGAARPELDIDGMPAAHRQALDQLFSVTYEELRRLASSVRRGDPSATLSPTPLVNEAWLKLADSRQLATPPQLPFTPIPAPAIPPLLAPPPPPPPPP